MVEVKRELRELIIPGSPAVTPSLLTIDPFRLMELMGWGEGMLRNANFTLPADTTVSLRIDVPEDQVWWITLGMFGGIPSDSIIYKFETEREVHVPLLLHEGWIGMPLCPPGYRRADRFVTATLQNVTGNPAYNDLPAQDLNVRTTVFIFMAWKRYVRRIEDALEQLTGMEVVRK